MTSFGFQQRSENQTQDTAFMGCFPNPKVDVKSSVLFIKKLTALAISNILFMRNLFDDKDFAERDMDGVKVKILKGGRSNSRGVQTISKWLEGVFDAIERKYLRVLIFEIIDSATSTVMERYQLRFRYQDGVSCTMENGVGDKARFTDNAEDTNMAVRQLIRNIFLLHSLHEALPPNCSFCMKLQYFDEVTPPEYEPPGFKSCADPLSELAGHSFRLGSVSTPFHVLGVSSKAAKATQQPAEEDQSVPSMAFEENQAPQTSEEINAHDQKGNISEESNAVNCECGLVDKNDNIMLLCNKCKTFQHGGCYKVFRVDEQLNEISHKHLCTKCTEDQAICSDVNKDMCLLRRSLLLCATYASISLRKLMQDLQLDESTAGGLMRRLIREEALKRSTMPFSMKKPENIFAVHKQNLIQKTIPKFFDDKKENDNKKSDSKN